MNRNILLFLVVGLTLACSPVSADPLVPLAGDTRCPVCGMFVAKYDAWITQIIYEDKRVESFDGVKDMLAYYFHPQEYGGLPDSKCNEIWVKDYYTLAWIEGRKAWYVTGSDVYGPMGHEFIPFSSKPAAEAFAKDHHGKKILPFSEITAQMVEALRSGTKMR